MKKGGRRRGRKKSRGSSVSVSAGAAERREKKRQRASERERESRVDSREPPVDSRPECYAAGDKFAQRARVRRKRKQRETVWYRKGKRKGAFGRRVGTAV